MAEQNFTGNTDFTVPAGVTSVTIECWGRGGTYSAGYAAYGSYAKGTYTVTPGEILKVHCDTFAYRAADVRRGGDALTNRIIVAGAAGQYGFNNAEWSVYPPSGAYPNYSDNDKTLAGNGQSGTLPSPGGDGLAGAGGSAGSGGSPSGSGALTSFGSSGGLGVGGGGGSTSDYTPIQADYDGGVSADGGRGGDGYYGGGGGGAQCRFAHHGSTWAASAPGGSGSSYTGTGTDAVINAWSRNGAAIVKITWNVVTNYPPNAPLLLTPADAAVLATSDDIVFDWNFSDPDAGNTQSRWELEVRAQGSGTNTIDLDSATPPGSGYAAGIVGTQTAITVPAGTLIADDWEWRVLTYDQSPLVGVWSGWRPFTLAAPPTGPVITAPANLSTVTSGTRTVTWTVTVQNAYEVRRQLFSDSSILWTSGIIENSTARSHVVTFPTDNQTENVQVRVRVNGIWSGWSSVRITTDFLPPMTPTIVVTPEDTPGFIRVAVTHPTPTGGAPAVSSTELWVRTAAGRDDYRADPNGVLVGTMGATLPDYRAASGVTYEYRARAIATTGEASYSAWQTGTLYLRGMFVQDIDLPSDNVVIWLGEESESWDTGTEVRRYGGGRRRSVRRPGVDLVVSFEIARMDAPVYRALRDKTGQTVLVRTPRGRKIYGVISALEVTEIINRNQVAASFAVTETM